MQTRVRRDAWEVYSKTFAATVAVYLVILTLERLLEAVIRDRVLCWATASAAVQTVAIVFLSLSLVVWRSYTRLKASIHDQMRPAIRDRVLALAFEGESWSTPVPGNGPGRQVLEESLAHALATVKAAGRERVACFAVEHGFAEQWTKAFSSSVKGERRRAVALLGLISPVGISPVAGNAVLLKALHDEDAAVRAEAARALLVAGDGLSVDQVFRSALREPLLPRALLADGLKRHAAYLLAHTVPSVLETGSKAEIARCFEILIAWKRALPGFDLRPWLAVEGDAAFSRLMLRLLPYVWTEDAIEDYVRAGLENTDLDVQCAAAEAAGRMKLEGLLPQLTAALNGDKRLGVAAANAMANIGESGEQWLERVVAGPNRKAAAVALEALEHRTVKPL